VINLEIKRNDPCPCGSGKKYKKCCLQKVNVIQMQEVKQERFFQTKHDLVLKLEEFSINKISRIHLYHLQSEFKKRSQHAIDVKVEDGFFEFWLFFFHRFENGLRGIEWFMDENGAHLSQEEKQMANTWLTLTPKIVQAVNKENDIILFEDVFTKEQFHVADTRDNVPFFAPWYGTVALLEPFNDLFYFNGVRIFGDPTGVDRAGKKVQELVEDTNLSREQVMMEYFPEVLAALIIDDEVDNQKREIHEYKLQYKVLNVQALSTFINSDEQFAIDTWNENKKLCSWVLNWYKYTDSEISNPIFMGEVNGKLAVEHGILQFYSLDEARVDAFKQIIQPLIDSSVLSFMEQQVKTITIPFQAEIRDMMFSFDKNTPQYFAHYTQGDLRFEFGKKIHKFDGLSLTELMEDGREHDAENWLKQMEYNMYLQVHQQYKNVEATADFNTVRKELGLALSPFVTGGDKRKSTFERITVAAEENQIKVKQEDIPFYEQLGFTPDTINNFYAEDFVAFYKEKATGKSENTIRKYKSSLTDLKEILEQHSMTNWEECDQAFWRQVFEKEFKALYRTLTKTLVKDFISTTKALAKWLDQREKTSSLSKVVVQVSKETEDELLRSVEVVNIY
jgi:hypothetical protein